MTIATVIIAVFTVGAVLVALHAYRESAEMNRRSAVAESHALAVAVLQDYMKLAIEHPELANRPDRQPVDDRYEWLASHAYSSAEAIYNLTRGEAPWDSTVVGIIVLHHRLVKERRYTCHDYSPGFDSLVKNALKNEYRCVE